MTSYLTRHSKYYFCTVQNIVIQQERNVRGDSVSVGWSCHCSFTYLRKTATFEIDLGPEFKKYSSTGILENTRTKFKKMCRSYQWPHSSRTLYEFSDALYVWPDKNGSFKRSGVQELTKHLVLWYWCLRYEIARRRLGLLTSILRFSATALELFSDQIERYQITTPTRSIIKLWMMLNKKCVKQFVDSFFWENIY